MKKILVFLSIGLLLGSCSDKLTSSKAEKLIQEALEKEPIIGEVNISTGDHVQIEEEWTINDSGNLSLFTLEEMIKKYERLRDDGVITMSFVEKKAGYSEYEYFYSIHLTDKGKQYVLSTKDEKSYQVHIVKTYSATLNGVKDIHLIPEWNGAEVLVSFKLDKTPFSILQAKYQDRDEVSNRLSFKKLEEKGWAVGYVGLN